MAVGGKPELEILSPEGTFEMISFEPRIGDVSPMIIEIPPLFAVNYFNYSETETTTFIVLSDYAWRPNDDESIKYNGWNDHAFTEYRKTQK